MATMKKKVTPMIHAKTKFHDRALSCGNHTFLPYDCPVILQRGGEGGAGFTLYLLGKGCCSNLKQLTLAIESRVRKTEPPFPFPKFEVMTDKQDQMA